MKTEVRKEHGDWIVFVDDNPQFSFMHREEAEKVRNMVDIIIQVKQAYQGVGDLEGSGENLMELIPEIDKVLSDVGCSK